MPEDLSQLLETSRYDVAILPKLEAHVEEQCKAQAYDVDVCLATLKLYQFNPSELKEPMVAKILIKALMNLPNTDYLACTYLVPERVQEAEPIKTITAVASLLETCSFRAFWEAVKPLRADLLSAMPGFDAAIRAFILRTFEITYQSVPTSHLRASLGFDSEADFTKLVGSKGWTIDGDRIQVALNDDNTAKPKRIDATDTMDFAQMKKILASVAASS